MQIVLDGDAVSLPNAANANSVGITASPGMNGTIFTFAQAGTYLVNYTVATPPLPAPTPFSQILAVAGNPNGTYTVTLGPVMATLPATADALTVQTTLSSVFGFAVSVTALTPSFPFLFTIQTTPFMPFTAMGNDETLAAFAVVSSGNVGLSVNGATTPINGSVSDIFYDTNHSYALSIVVSVAASGTISLNNFTGGGVFDVLSMASITFVKLTP